MASKVLPFVWIVAACLMASGAAAQETFIFCVEQAVNGSDKGGWFIEPIAAMRYGKFYPALSKPASDDERDQSVNGEIRSFAEEYLPVGRNLPLLYNNDRVGVAKITAHDSAYNTSKGLAHCSVYFSGVQTISGGDHGIVILDSTRKDKSIFTRAATQLDSFDAFHSARRRFTIEKVPKNVIAETKLSSIRLSDINADGKAELIASFETAMTTRTDDIKWVKVYTFSVILSPQPDGTWKELYSFYYAQRNEEAVHRQYLADCCDVDNDGICEVIFKNYYLDGDNYSIIKRNDAGVWKEVYIGG